MIRKWAMKKSLLYSGTLKAQGALVYVQNFIFHFTVRQQLQRGFIFLMALSLCGSSFLMSPGT